MTLGNLLEHACCAAALMASSSVTSKIRGVNEELNFTLQPLKVLLLPDTAIHMIACCYESFCGRKANACGNTSHNHRPHCRGLSGNRKQCYCRYLSISTSQWILLPAVVISHRSMQRGVSVNRTRCRRSFLVIALLQAPHQFSGL